MSLSDEPTSKFLVALLSNSLIEEQYILNKDYQLYRPPEQGQKAHVVMSVIYFLTL